MRFVKESQVAAKPADVFAFHERSDALERLVPPWEPVEIVEPPKSIQVGSRAVFQGKMGPIPIKWIAEHTEYDPPHKFADRQVSGPFAKWYHRHQFLDDGQGGTIMRDEVEYEPPGGFMGRMLGESFIQQKLKKMFDYRHEVIHKAIAAGEIPSR